MLLSRSLGFIHYIPCEHHLSALRGGRGMDGGQLMRGPKLRSTGERIVL